MLSIQEINPDDNEYSVTWPELDPEGTQPSSSEDPSGIEFDTVEVL